MVMTYDVRGQGEPCVMLHPGGAGVERVPTLAPIRRAAPETR